MAYAWRRVNGLWTHVTLLQALPNCPYYAFGPCMGMKSILPLMLMLTFDVFW